MLRFRYASYSTQGLALFASCVVFIISVRATIAAEVAFEAEDVTNIQPPMEIREEKEASGGKYLVSPVEGVNGFVDYTIDIPEKGEWVIWGRVIARNGDQDSFLIVDFDDTKTKPKYGDDKFRWTVRNSAVWVWDQVNAVAGDDPRVFKLTKGEHLLRIWNRENNTQLDVLYMTTDKGFLEWDVNARYKDVLAKKEQGVEPKEKLSITWGSIKQR